MKIRALKSVLLAGTLLAAGPVAAQQQTQPQQEPALGAQQEPAPGAPATAGRDVESQAQALVIEQLLAEVEEAIEREDFRAAHDALDQVSARAQEAMLEDRGGFPREQLQELELAVSEAQTAVRGEDAQAARAPLREALQLIEEARAALPSSGGQPMPDEATAQQPLAQEPTGQQQPAGQQQQ